MKIISLQMRNDNKNSNRKNSKKHWEASNEIRTIQYTWHYFYKSSRMSSHWYNKESNIFLLLKSKMETITISDAIYTTNFGAQTNKKSNVRAGYTRKWTFFVQKNPRRNCVGRWSCTIQYNFVYSRALTHSNVMKQCRSCALAKKMERKTFQTIELFVRTVFIKLKWFNSSYLQFSSKSIWDLNGSISSTDGGDKVCSAILDTVCDYTVECELCTNKFCTG